MNTEQEITERTEKPSAESPSVASVTSCSKQLPLFAEKPQSQNVEWFVTFLQGRDWITAADLLRECSLEVTENNKRKLRALAEASQGRICGHQKGYKLTTTMTHEEYQWWRNEWLKADAAIQARVVQSDKVFYSRQPV